MAADYAPVVLSALLTLDLLAAIAFGAPVEVRALAGAQIDSDSHGELDVGVRSGPWSAEVFTDTLDLRWSPVGERGRSWVAVRAEGLAAGLMITPWRRGGPEPAMALVAGYAGPEFGTVRYLPLGWYTGAEGGAKLWFFDALDATTIDAPGPTFVGTADAFIGLSREDLGVRGWLRAGSFFVAPNGGAVATLPTCGAPGECEGETDFLLVGREVAPFASGELTWHPTGLVVPRAEFRAGIADGVGAALATRVGGQMPYVVPLAGAAWGEFWAAGYVAGRAGLAVGDSDAGPGSGTGAETAVIPADTRTRVRGMLLADLVGAVTVLEEQPESSLPPELVFPPPATPIVARQAGFAARLELRRNQFWLQTEAGWAPWIERQEGVQNWAIMARVGMDWTAVGRPDR